MSGTVLSQAFCDGLQSPRAAGLVSVQFTQACGRLPSYWEDSLEKRAHDQNYMLQLS